jgi:hypothetical protein
MQATFSNFTTPFAGSEFAKSVVTTEMIKMPKTCATALCLSQMQNWMTRRKPTPDRLSEPCLPQLPLGHWICVNAQDADAAITPT